MIALLLLGVAPWDEDRPQKPPEHVRAYSACKTLLREVYEENRKNQRPELSPEEFWRQVTFDDVQTDTVKVESLGAGVYRVEGGAERPARLRHGGRFYGRFICQVKESWTKVGPTTVLG